MKSCFIKMKMSDKNIDNEQDSEKIKEEKETSEIVERDEEWKEKHKIAAALDFLSLGFAGMICASCFLMITLIILISCIKENPSDLLKETLGYSLVAIFTVLASATGYVFGERRRK